MPLPSLHHLRIGLLCSAAVLLAGVAKSDAALHITEFLANNSISLNDENGDSSDWIELFNSGPGSASLEGYFLTDDPAALTKSIFLRPNLSVGFPTNKAPTMVPINALATVKPKPPSLSSNRSFSFSVVPEITAVSKPNRNPPRAATREICKI
jgi:hypothetical protein